MFALPTSMGIGRPSSGGGGGDSTVSFDPARKSGNVTLSGSDKTASNSNGGGHWWALCTLPKSSGKWVYEMTVNSLPSSGNLGFGIVDQAEVMAQASPAITSGGNYWGRQTSPLCRHYDGTAFTVLGTSGTIPVQGDVITITIDLDTEEMKAYRNGSLISTKTITTIDTGTKIYVPFVDLWGSVGTPATVTINSNINHPQAGFTPWA
jgi:hypothetical protein